MSEKDIISGAKNLLQQNINLNDETISLKALEYINNNKKKLERIFLTKQNSLKKVYFMAGSPGAGKSEIALMLSENKNIDIFDTDEIRKICPHYSGKNSNLFQKASSRGIDILINTAFKKNYSFILDGNFSNYELQDKNISRALKRDYEIEIYFVYRPLEIAKEYTRIREEKEGRKVPDNIFYQKFLDAVETVNKIAKEYKEIKINFFDLHKDYYKQINNLDEMINNNSDFINDINVSKLSMKKLDCLALNDKKEIETNYSKTLFSFEFNKKELDRDSNILNEQSMEHIRNEVKEYNSNTDKNNIRKNR